MLVGDFSVKKLYLSLVYIDVTMVCGWTDVTSRSRLDLFLILVMLVVRLCSRREELKTSKISRRQGWFYFLILER